MSLNFSQVRKTLSQKFDSTLHRNVIVFAGESVWQNKCLQELLFGYEKNCLWFGENALSDIPSISGRDAQSWLGREKQVVIFDANSQFNTDAFAAITGIVVGGGLFILLMPATEQWDEVYLSYFGQRLIQSITSTPTLFMARQSDEQFNFSVAENKASPQNCIEPFLTTEQQHVVEIIEAEVRGKKFNPVVINSDRGRGKSAALGIAAARLVESGIKTIAITAPRLHAAEIIFKHIKLLLPQAEMTQGKVKYKNRTIQFYAPDLLIAEDINTEMVFIDEAAAIPVPLLMTILEKYPYCVFSTTVHGYEGTGRGFSLRFTKILNEKKPGWKKCLMKIPVRWAENDPLEEWMFSLLCLDAEIVSPYSIGIIEQDKLEILCLSHSQIAQDESLLNEVFALLVLAHYRTQPSDLQRMLDDEHISLYIVKYNQHVLSVALVSHEGKFSDSLSTQVYRGERRPHGHLLAQALTYHCGVENAATLNYARIMRIAVHPDYQQQGLGTKLLSFVINNEKDKGCDAVGTSFGMNKSLLHFWKKSDFSVVRIGFKREQTSGEHAAIMLLPLSMQGEKVKHAACSRFAGQLSYWFEDVLKDMSLELKNEFIIQNNESYDLTQLDKEDLHSFIQYSRNYELCISVLNKLVLSKQNKIIADGFPDNFRQVLTLKVINKADWKDIGKIMSLTGQDEVRKLFQSAIVYLSK